MALLQVTCESFATTIDDPVVRFNNTPFSWGANAIECWHCGQIMEASEHGADPSGEEAGRHTPQHCSILSTVKPGAEGDHRSRASMLT
jgi:hypothetical protein